MNNFYEFFFCPIHGIFRPANLALILPAIGGIWIACKAYASLVIEKFRARAMQFKSKIGEVN
jgi:hypothetical protein